MPRATPQWFILKELPMANVIVYTIYQQLTYLSRDQLFSKISVKRLTKWMLASGDFRHVNINFVDIPANKKVFLSEKNIRQKPKCYNCIHEHLIDEM